MVKLNKMKEIKDLQVTVTYKVGLGGLKVTEEVYNQLMEIFEKGQPIDPSGISGIEYPAVSDWIGGNIEERDCFDWEFEIDELK